MNKITIEFKKRIVEFYNVPHTLARAIETILHYVESDMDNNVVSGESEVD